MFTGVKNFPYLSAVGPNPFTGFYSSLDSTAVLLLPRRGLMTTGLPVLRSSVKICSVGCPSFIALGWPCKDHDHFSETGLPILIRSRKPRGIRRAEVYQSRHLPNVF